MAFSFKAAAYLVVVVSVVDVVVVLDISLASAYLACLSGIQGAFSYLVVVVDVVDVVVVVGVVVVL